ncbi:MAG TPA: histidinol-phosphate transaminase [Polyangiaceae bacterium]|nr:histidinol-phosphate transaminase [Polyangiaceae bacterium]
MIRARPAVEVLHRYVAPLEGRRGLLRLDFNENTLGPSPKVVAAIRALPPEAYATYPEYAGLVEAYAEHAGVPADSVAVFNGADAAIRSVFDAFGSPGSVLLTTAPTFGYYAPCAQIAGMTVDAVPYASDLSFPWAAFEARLQQKPRLCIICNPNNPTSTLIEPAKILELARAFPDTLFVVDEIYVSFTGLSVVPEATRLDNVLALRSLSKSMGMAGLRLGFVCGAPGLVERTFRVTGPYDINAFAVIAGKAALGDVEYMQGYVAEVAAAKAFTHAELERMGLRYFSQGGNYLLVWPGRDVVEVESELRARGILVRSMAGKPVIDGSFRLSVGTREQMQQFFAALEDIVRPETPRRSAAAR